MKEPSENAKIARLYRDVPPELVTRLRHFRARYPYQRTTIGGREWRYIDTARGEAALLALSGAACIAEMSWQSIEHFAQRYRVIAPDYPAIDTMGELVDGMAGILDQKDIRQAHVMGGSYGGLVAQVFVRRHPSRTASLILSHTLLPEREGAEQVAKATRWMRLLPAPVLRAFFQKRLGRLFGEGQHPQVMLSKALFTEIVNYHLTKGQLISLLQRTVDVGINYRFTPQDLDHWQGRILLLMAEDDPATPEPVRQAITAMYPQAQARLFSGSGHMTAVLQQDEYFAATDEFLSAAPA